jgi:hypothetical protein
VRRISLMFTKTELGHVLGCLDRDPFGGRTRVRVALRKRIGAAHERLAEDDRIERALVKAGDL